MRYLVALLTLAGCTSMEVAVPIDYSVPPPADWPRLREEIRRVSKDEIPVLCRGDSAHWSACARIDFKARVCRIYIAVDHPGLLEHERGHCRGYDHPGQSWRSKMYWEMHKESVK